MIVPPEGGVKGKKRKICSSIIKADPTDSAP
jgi:hypothetical protein